MLRSLRVLLALSLAAGVAGAQGAPPRIPNVAAATAGIKAPRAQFSPSPEPRFTPTHSEKLMIVGGVIFVAGALIASGSNDTIGALMMVAGAVVGIYGLIKYLE